MARKGRMTGVWYLRYGPETVRYGTRGGVDLTGRTALVLAGADRQTEQRAFVVDVRESTCIRPGPAVWSRGAVGLQQKRKYSISCKARSLGIFPENSPSVTFDFRQRCDLRCVFFPGRCRNAQIWEIVHLFWDFPHVVVWEKCARRVAARVWGVRNPKGCPDMGLLMAIVSYRSINPMR